MSTIHKFPLKSNFSIVSNYSAEDPNLTWSAKGLLWYILSRPENWTVHVWHLEKIYCGEKKGQKRDAIQEMLKELRGLGYVKFSRFQDAQGKWKCRYDVFPVPEALIQKMFPQQDYPAPVVPAQVNPVVVTSTDPNKKISKKIIIATPTKVDIVPTPEQVPAGGNNNFPASLAPCGDLSENQKRQFAKYPESVVADAVRYCYHEKTKLEGPQARIKQLHAFCKDPIAYSDTLKHLDSPAKGKTLKEQILSVCKKGESYNGFEFTYDDGGPMFIDAKNNHLYSLRWNESDLKIKWYELLKKLGLVK